MDEAEKTAALAGLGMSRAVFDILERHVTNCDMHIELYFKYKLNCGDWSLLLTPISEQRGFTREIFFTAREVIQFVWYRELDILNYAPQPILFFLVDTDHNAQFQLGTWSEVASELVSERAGCRIAAMLENGEYHDPYLLRRVEEARNQIAAMHHIVAESAV